MLPSFERLRCNGGYKCERSFLSQKETRGGCNILTNTEWTKYICLCVYVREGHGGRQ